MVSKVVINHYIRFSPSIKALSAIIKLILRFYYNRHDTRLLEASRAFIAINILIFFPSLGPAFILSRSGRFTHHNVVVTVRSVLDPRIRCSYLFAR